MNKWIFCLLGWLPICLIAQSASFEKEMKGIEAHIQILKERLNVNQREQIKEEMRGEGLMIADWEAYGRDLQHVRQLEQRELEIRHEIQQLEERRAVLMKHQIESTTQT